MTWALMAHRSELAKPGDYVLLSGIEQMAAVNLDGEIIVTDNICAHRRARVLSGACGNKPLTCPYHGYSGKATISQQYLTRWCGDFLFASEDSAQWFPQEIEEYVAEISSHIERRYSMDVLPMPCDWKVAVENALEDAHVPCIHPDTFAKLRLTDAAFDRFGEHSGAIYRVGDERTVSGLAKLAKNFRSGDPTKYFHLLLYPFTCISSVGGFSYSVQQYVPMHGYTQLHARLYAAKPSPGAANMEWFFAEAQQFNRRVFDQDSAICATVQGVGGTLTEAERRVKWFREELA